MIKALKVSLLMLIKQISHDGMLIMACFAPILLGVVLYYILPKYIEPYLSFNISNYYLILDLMVAVMTSFLFCFVSTLTILEEMDDNIAPYMIVTPLGKRGYLISRLFIPAIIAAFITIIPLSFWSLSNLSLLMAIVISSSSSLLSIITSMLVIVLAKNKVEGIALSKISGILLIGFFIPFFVQDSYQYLFSFLPSFWIAKMAITNTYLYLIPMLICSFIWLLTLLHIYKRKLL